MITTFLTLINCAFRSLPRPAGHARPELCSAHEFSSAIPAHPMHVPSIAPRMASNSANSAHGQKWGHNYFLLLAPLGGSGYGHNTPFKGVLWPYTLLKRAGFPD